MQKEDKSWCEFKGGSKIVIIKCGVFIPMNKDEKCVLILRNTKYEIEKM